MCVKFHWDISVKTQKSHKASSIKIKYPKDRGVGTVFGDVIGGMRDEFVPGQE